MDERDRSRSPIAPVASPVIVSNSNAEEMDGTENYGSVNHRPSERRQVRPGEGRRAEVGVIGQQRQQQQQTRTILMQQTWQGGHGVSLATAVLPPPPPSATRLEWYEYAVARTSTVATLNAAAALVRAIHAYAQAAPAAPARPALGAAPADRASGRATGRVPIARTARASARDELPRVSPHRVHADATAPGDEPLPIPPPVRLRPRPTPTPSTPGAQLTAIARTRMAASERLKAIAASLADEPPTRTSVSADAKSEAIERIRVAIRDIEDVAEREEATRMMERILAPGSLHSIRSLYQQMPLWEENAPPPAGWPFRLPGQRADLLQRQQAEFGSVSREREYNRDANRRNRHVEASEAARDLFEELLASGIVPLGANGGTPRVPRAAPDLLPSFEMVQLRDLPAMLAVRETRGVPPEHRVEEGDEQVVPTGPSMRSPHAVPVINSQANLREGYEHDYRRRINIIAADSAERRQRQQQAAAAAASAASAGGYRRTEEQMRQAAERGEEPLSRDPYAAPRPPPYPLPPTDTPHPGVVERTVGEPNVASPLAELIPRMMRERMHRMQASQLILPEERRRRYMREPASPTDSIISLGGEDMNDEDDDDQEQAGPSTSQSVPSSHSMPLQHRQLQSGGPPPSTSSIGRPPAVTTKEVSQSTIKVHKLRPSAHRGPSQRKEASGLVGARRICLEQRALEEKGGVERVEAAPKPENVRTWTAVVEGAEGSQFEGGVFFFDIFFPQAYPMGGIKIACLTHIVHPHVHFSGQVDLDKIAQLCFGVQRFAEIKYGGLEKSLRVVAEVVSGKLPIAAPDQEKQWIERGKVFTKRYAC